MTDKSKSVFETLTAVMDRVVQNVPSGCWLWRGAKSSNGYGQHTVAGNQVGAHRWAYELLIGPIPPGMVLDHVAARGCVHRHCVNPAHLEPVTCRENVVARGGGITAINAAKTECIHGHALDEANTYWRPDRPGVRQCRACVAEAMRRHRRSRRAA